MQPRCHILLICGSWVRSPALSFDNPNRTKDLRKNSGEGPRLIISIPTPFLLGVGGRPTTSRPDSTSAAFWTDADADADSITAPGLTKLTIQKGGLAANLNIASGGIGTISITGGSLIGSITDSGALTSLTISGGDLGGSTNLGGPLGTLKIAAVNSTGGNVLAGVAINTGTAAIGTLSAAGSFEGTGGQPIAIHAGSITTLSVAGAMDYAAVTLANPARKASVPALGTLSVKNDMLECPLTTDVNVTTVSVTGMLDNAAWYIAGALNSLTAGSAGGNWSADITG